MTQEKMQPLLTGFRLLVIHCHPLDCSISLFWPKGKNENLMQSKIHKNSGVEACCPVDSRKMHQNGKGKLNQYIMNKYRIIILY